jgi:hypothetical protein
MIRRWTTGVAAGAFCLLALCAGDATAGIAVDGLVHERVAKPGETYQGTITVRNTDDQRRCARLYQKDYLFFSDGTNVYGTAGEDARSNAEWISLSSNYVEVPARGSATVEYVAGVPRDESLTGSYWSLIMIEELPGDEAGGLKNAPDEMQARVRQALRYGVQLVTHLGDTGERTVRFTDKALVQPGDGTRTLQVDVENTGERCLRPHLWVELHDSSGSRLGRFESDMKRLYPGTSVRYSVDLSSAPSGSYQALVVVDNGDEHVFGAQYTMEF